MKRNTAENIRRFDRRASRGFTLIEMMAVLTAGTVLFGVAVGMLHLLMRTEQTGRDRVGQTAALTRLADQFRDDAAVALRFDPERRRFVLADRCEATYSLGGDAIHREERQNGRLLRRESFALPDGATATFGREAHDAARWASLTIHDDGSAARHAIGIVAPLGKDRRFVHSEKKKEP